MTNGDEWNDPIFSQPAPARASTTRLVGLGLVAASTVLAAALVTVLHRPAPREAPIAPASAQVTAAPALRPPPPASAPAVRAASVADGSRRRAPDILEERR